ncbi:hypothetical protein A3Q56_04040 [Intoshia linei]|uniref:Wiskott-Aldrich syndrome protein family member n=1 Tax=Intoshia linei TaxID=1819745 RepID=A0A177B1S0_9BILA|nr:hypothetical protein A3Q56_04040 [Intoshia linei]
MPLIRRVIEPVKIYQSNKNLSSSKEKIDGAGTQSEELESVANTGFCNIMRQLASFCEKTEGVFSELCQSINQISTKIDKLTKRSSNLSFIISNLDPSYEKISIEDINSHTPYRSDLHRIFMIVTPETRTQSIKQLYSNCFDLPQLFKLDQYRTDGVKSMSLYSDPNYFAALLFTKLSKSKEEHKKKKKKSKDIYQTLSRRKVSDVSEIQTNKDKYKKMESVNVKYKEYFTKDKLSSVPEVLPQQHMPAKTFDKIEMEFGIDDCNYDDPFIASDCNEPELNSFNDHIENIPVPDADVYQSDSITDPQFLPPFETPMDQYGLADDDVNYDDDFPGLPCPMDNSSISQQPIDNIDSSFPLPCLDSSVNNETYVESFIPSSIPDISPPPVMPPSVPSCLVVAPPVCIAPPPPISVSSTIANSTLSFDKCGTMTSNTSTTDIPPVSNDRSNFLLAIHKGMNLRNVSTSSGTSKNKDTNDVQSMLENAFELRRQQMEYGSDDGSSDNSWSTN